MEDRLRSESLTTAAAGLFELVLQRVEGLDGDVLQTGSADVGHSKPHTQPIDQSPRLLTALTIRRERWGAVSCGCSDACWCRHAPLALFRWVAPFGHRG